MKMEPLRIAILGPTCSGKSATALELAAQLGAEIISCDSMQVYRGMDIGTAKPTPDEQQRVCHHMVDVLDLSQPYNVNIFLDRCRPVINTLNHTPTACVLVGGSGLYARSLLYGHRLLPSDKNVYAAVWAAVQAGQIEELVAELATASPACAVTVGKNPRHLARAVEILRLTGMTPDNPLLRADNANTEGGIWHEIIIIPPWPEQRELIAARTRKMLADGWIEETRRLLDAGLENAPTARQALGYLEIIAYLRGEITRREELESRIATKTMQLARRQRTWFKHQHPHAIQVPAFMFDPTAGVETCLKILRGRGACL